MSFDGTSYAMGHAKGKAEGEGHVIIEDTVQYTFTDPNNDGHIVITKVEEGES